MMQIELRASILRTSTYDILYLILLAHIQGHDINQCFRITNLYYSSKRNVSLVLPTYHTANVDNVDQGKRK